MAREKRAAFADEDYWAARCPASATPARACSCSAWRRPRTAATAPAACSPATARATGCSRRCTAPASRTSPIRCSAGDGLELRGAFVAAAVRCAPPANKPLPEERDNCLPYAAEELRADPAARRSSAWASSPGTRPACSSARPRPRFGHLAEFQVPEGPVLIGSFHPSQQNTFTGKLTEPMLDAVFERAAHIAGEVVMVPPQGTHSRVPGRPDGRETGDP